MSAIEGLSFAGARHDGIRSIIFVTFHFPPEIGGIQTRISHYVSELAGRGIDVSALVLKSKGSTSKVMITGNLEIMTRPGHIRYFIGNARVLARSIFIRRVDVIHVFTGASTLFGAFAIILGRISGRRSVIGIFGEEDLAFSGLVGKTMFAVSASLSTGITTNSKYTGNLLPRRFRRKVHVLSGGAEKPHHNDVPPSYNSKTILFVGRLVTRKGVDDLLRAFAIARKSVPDAKLVIAGDGPEREKLKHIAFGLGIYQSVEFVGILQGDDLQDAYARCALCVLPSKKVQGDTATEGLGLSLVEASFYSKPLLGTYHGGIPEVITHGSNGILVPEGNASKLGEAMGKLLSNSALLEELGSRAYEKAVKEFTWDAATDRLLEAYEI